MTDVRRGAATAPRNAASDRIAAILPMWASEDHASTHGRRQLADDFVHEDRRSLVAVPSTDADGYVEQILDLYRTRRFEVWIDGVLAVRGERLALCVRGQTVTEGSASWTSQRLAVVQFDERIDLIERLVNFIGTARGRDRRA